MFGNKNKLAKEVLEIDYHKENRVLQEIIKVTYETKDIISASNKIIQIICSNYNIEYCTLFLLTENRFKIAGTNIPLEMYERIENFAELIYKEKCEGKVADAYVLKSAQPMNYDTGWERGIKYLMFSPLISTELVGCILIENSKTTLTQDEVQFFELVVENIALVLQNLIYFKQTIDQANKDGLTGIYNRKYMNEHLNAVCEVYKQSGRKFALALFDIDHFKNFNDTYGHLHGDKVLKEVCSFVQREIRTCDCVYRYGGEEIVIFLSDMDSNSAYEFLDKLRFGISNLKILTDRQNEETRVTVSIGVSEFPLCDMNAQGLVEKADKAMYYSKENGRNKVTKYIDLQNNINTNTNMN